MIGDAVSTLTLKRTRSRNALRCSVRSSCRRALIAASRPSSKLMSPVKPASSIVTCPPSTNVSPLLTRRMLASERLRKSSGASNATSSVVSSSATSAMPPSPSTTYPDPSSRPPLTDPVRFEREMRLPVNSTRPVTSSAATPGSSTTKDAFVRSTKPFSSGASAVPRTATCRRVSPSARTTSVNIETTAMFRLPLRPASIGRLPIRPTVPVAARVPTDPDRFNVSTVAVPPAMRTIEGACCASVSPLKANCSSGNAIRPSSAARSARAAAICASTLMRPDSPSGAPGICAGIQIHDRCSERCGAALPGNLDGQCGQHLERNAPRASRRATPQLATS